MRFSKREKLTKEEEYNIKFAAYSTLIDLNERSLPVLSEFTHLINSSIYILPLQFIIQKLGYNKNFFYETGDGVAIYVSETKHCIILYDEQLPDPDIRWTISKLLYLVKSGKLQNQPDIFHYSDCPENIEKCNVFAYYFTCPDVILKECNINNASDIIRYCKIPFLHANRKSRLLNNAADNNSLQSIEKILNTNFSSYTKQMRN